MESCTVNNANHDAHHHAIGGGPCYFLPVIPEYSSQQLQPLF
jgi:hypothetical protein